MFLGYTSNHSSAVFYGREVAVNTEPVCKQSLIGSTRRQRAWISWVVRYCVPRRKISAVISKAVCGSVSSPTGLSCWICAVAV